MLLKWWRGARARAAKRAQVRTWPPADDGPLGGPGHYREAWPVGFDVEALDHRDAPSAMATLEGDTITGTFAPGRIGSAPARPSTAPGGSPRAKPAPSGPSRTERAGDDWLRSRVTRENPPEIQAMLEKPEVPLSISQRVLLQQLGQQTTAGDQGGVRQTLAELVQRLDVSSRPDSAVLLRRETLGDDAEAQARAALDKGKQTVDSTQGGRVFSSLRGVLAKYLPRDVLPDVDRNWSQLTDRFAGQASGAVEVVVGVRPAEGSAAGAAQGATDWRRPTEAPGTADPALDRGISRAGPLAEVLARNPHVSTINFTELVAPSAPGGPTQLQRLGSLTREALMQRLARRGTATPGPGAP